MKDESVLGMYLKEINKITLLSNEEETALALAAKKGDRIAKDKIIVSNLRFVVNVAKKYQNHGMELEDLISEGNIGLMTAIDKFDVSKGYHFISYAVWWIRQSITKAIYGKSRAIRLPMNRVNELVQIDQARKSITGNLSDKEEIEEIGILCGMTSAHVTEMLNISREMVSLDAPVGTTDVDSVVGDYIQADDRTNPSTKAIDKCMEEDINSVLDTLKPNEAKVIRLRYGLNGAKPLSLKECGDECNLTKERIRQIEKTAIVRMQHPTRSRRLADYHAA